MAANQFVGESRNKNPANVLVRFFNPSKKDISSQNTKNLMVNF